MRVLLSALVTLRWAASVLAATSLPPAMPFSFIQETMLLPAPPRPTTHTMGRAAAAAAAILSASDKSSDAGFPSTALASFRMSFINNKWHERRNIKPATTLKRAGKAKIRPEFSHECSPFRLEPWPRWRIIPKRHHRTGMHRKDGAGRTLGHPLGVGLPD